MIKSQRKEVLTLIDELLTHEPDWKKERLMGRQSGLLELKKMLLPQSHGGHAEPHPHFVNDGDI